MHFCFLIQGFLIGNKGNNIVGPHVQSYLMAKGLMARGFEVSYICLTDDAENAGRMQVVEGMNVYFLKSKTLHHRLEELVAFRKVYRLLKKIKPDIIYTRGRSSFPFITGRYARKFKKKSMWSGARDQDFNRYEYLKKKYSELNFFLKPVSFLINYIIMIALFESGLRKTNIIFVQNENQLENIRKIMNSENVEILPQITYECVKKTEKSDKINVLWVSGIKKEKQPEKFIEIAKTVNDPRFIFQMVGPILDAGYEKVLNDAGSISNFSYLGSKNYFETMEVFRKSDIFINTTLNEGNEGFPNTIVQAWSYGSMVLTLGVNPNKLLNSFLGYSCSSSEEIIEKLKQIADKNLLAENEDKIIDYVNKNHIAENVLPKIIRKFK